MGLTQQLKIAAELSIGRLVNSKKAVGEVIALAIQAGAKNH